MKISSEKKNKVKETRKTLISYQNINRIIIDRLDIFPLNPKKQEFNVSIEFI